jgi:hypothetical protein
LVVPPGSEVIEARGQRTPAAPHPGGLIRAGTKWGLDLLDRLCSQVPCGSGRDAG